jgi:hypothetical protein
VKSHQACKVDANNPENVHRKRWTDARALQIRQKTGNSSKESTFAENFGAKRIDAGSPKEGRNHAKLAEIQKCKASSQKTRTYTPSLHTQVGKPLTFTVEGN